MAVFRPIPFPISHVRRKLDVFYPAGHRGGSNLQIEMRGGLDGDNGFAVCGECRVRTESGVVGQRMKLPAGVGNHGDLAAQESGVARSDAGQNGFSIWEPGRFEEKFVFGGSYETGITGGGVDGEVSGKIGGGGLHDRDHDGFSVRGPRQRVTVNTQRSVFEDRVVWRTVAMRLTEI